MEHPATKPLTAAADSPRIIAWEVTRQCPLACKHCRAGARDHAYEGELTTEECLRVLDSLVAPPHPMIIFTGGEPMYRHDIQELVRAATARGLRSVMAPCGTLITRESLRMLREAGVMACSFSLDGATAASHDAFRGVPGAFENVTRAMSLAREMGMPFQVNVSVSKLNRLELPRIREQAIALGATTLDLFFLVPVGRGSGISDLALPPTQCDEVLRWAFDMDAQGPIRVKETCAPQAVRIWHERGRPGRQPSGCMGGKGFVFISHTGVLQPCGFLDLPCGDLREFDFNLPRAYHSSKVFRNLRKTDDLKGFCGQCGFRAACSGCRARAYAATGDYMESETTCALACSATSREK